APSGSIIFMLASIILLLFGILLRLQQLREEVLHKNIALNKCEYNLSLLGENLPNTVLFKLQYTEKKTFRFKILSENYNRLFDHDRKHILEDAGVAFKHVHPDDRPILQKAFEQGLQTLEAVDIEIRYRDASGHFRWLHVNSATHYNHEEGVVWDGFLQDISPQKQVENHLKEENRNFQNLFETVDDFLVVCDSEKNVIYTNKSVENLLGLSSDQVLNMPLPELYIMEDRTKLEQILSQINKDQKSVNTLSMQGAEGITIPVEVRLFKGLWKDRQAIFCVAHDITRRLRTENALKAAQERTQLIMDTIPLSIFWKNRDSVFQGANKVFIKECGREHLNDIVGKTSYDLFELEFAEQVVQQDHQIILNDQPLLNFMTTYRRNDGTQGWREVTKVPIHNDAEEVIGILGVWQDVTERQKSEEKLRGTMDDLERFNQLMRGREKRTLELKKEVNEILELLGKPKKYQTTSE
ncbi:MAG TPA: PAS domain S-box protein, partial [Pontiella sp.]